MPLLHHKMTLLHRKPADGRCRIGVRLGKGSVTLRAGPGMQGYCHCVRVGGRVAITNIEHELARMLGFELVRSQGQDAFNPVSCIAAHEPVLIRIAESGLLH